MNFENKVTSREISQLLWEREETVGTAESCTGGRIAEAIISVPGASKYFKGGVISYTDDVKASLLGVDKKLLEEKTAVCEEVVVAMVKGACRTLDTTYAIASTGVAGPGGGTKDTPVGMIWVACGTEDEVVTYLLTEDNGRDVNLSFATNKAMQMFLEYLQSKEDKVKEEADTKMV
ncbi:CinA family protein [Xylanibacter muris]|uniref:CinA family protein n=1 Tax=Xylanibacter muris TaxID=2736290 RepID=A0ABX2APG3_9BACT|nr:CinA family protein [Xylanibacter muris]NPD92848.1 CinA family protein [Xylanibacter muris]